MEFSLLDLVLVVLLIGYILAGYRRGFTRSVAVLAGVAAGAVAAYFAIPLVGPWVPDPLWRVVASIAVALALIVAGHAVGAAIGGAVRARVKKSPLRVVDRALGAIVTGIAAALITTLLALGVTSLGVPVLSQTIASSTVLRTIDSLTPQPVEAFLAQLRSTVIDDGIPLITDVFDGITTSPDLPYVDTGTPALTKAAKSVVRITGTAFECGHTQTGSGFVATPDRVVTNAHVVAGVSDPVVELPGGGSRPGRVVYFDPVDDLAVIAVADLPTPALPMSATLPAGATGVVNGYPYGGPFTSGPAEVLSVTTSTVDDIHGGSSAEREIYTLAADVHEGNSGGPLISADGAVAGVVFARSADLANVGYAVTMTELGPVVAQAPSLTADVSSGACVTR